MVDYSFVLDKILYDDCRAANVSPKLVVATQNALYVSGTVFGASNFGSKAHDQVVKAEKLRNRSVSNTI
jgi:hypothetical protein